MYEDRATGEQKGGIEKVSYSHNAVIDMIISNPSIDQREIARRFGYSPGWISQLMASDSFALAFERRKEEMVDPIVRQSCEEQFKGLVLQSVEVLRKKLETQPSDHLALEVMKNASRALGYGAKMKVEGEVKHTHSLVAVLSSIPQTPRPTIDITPEAKQVAVG